MEKKFKEVCREIKVVLCDTQKLLKEAKKIRHEVFCVENGYEPIAINALEQDEYDEHSHHLLAMDRMTGESVGTMRIIISKDLPMDIHMPENHILKRTIFSGGKVVELSRLAVLSTYRGAYVAKASTALFLAAGFMVVKLGYNGAGAIMQESLARIIGRLGMKCTKITDSFEHRGLRSVYLMPSLDFIASWSKHTSYNRENFDQYFASLGDFGFDSCLDIISNNEPNLTPVNIERMTS